MLQLSLKNTFIVIAQVEGTVISAFDQQDPWYDPEQWAAKGQQPRTYCRATAGIPVKGPGRSINLTCTGLWCGWKPTSTQNPGASCWEANCAKHCAIVPALSIKI